jgi:hypothetical protein
VEASNSCAGTLISGSFFFIAFCQSFFSFFSAPFRFFFCLAFYCFFSFCRIGFCFYRPSFFLFFFNIVFIPVSLAHVVSSLAYPNLLGTKRLGCCCCCCWCVQSRDSHRGPATIVMTTCTNSTISLCRFTLSILNT